jgi:hypothetical protein
MGLRDEAGGVEKRCAGRACAVYAAVSVAGGGVVGAEGVERAVQAGGRAKVSSAMSCRPVREVVPTRLSQSQE